MSVSMTVTNLNEFNQTLGEYVFVSKKEFADGVNRQFNNLAIKAIRFTPKADSGRIRRLKNEHKLIAHWMTKNKTPKNPENKRLKKGGVFYTRAEAKRFANSVVKKRLGAVTFLKGFFVRMSDVIKQYSTGKTPTGKRYLEISPYFKPATTQNPSAYISVSYDYKRRSMTTSKRTESILGRALNMAIPATIADMKTYIARKAAERARQYSSTGKTISKTVGAVIR